MDSRILKKALWLVGAIVLSWGFFLSPVDSADNPTKYADKFGYFSLTPPKGWAQRDYPGETRGRVRFTAPGEKATMGLIVRPMEAGEETRTKLLVEKKRLVEKMRQKRPEGKYSLEETIICGHQCVKVNVEYPELIQENYLFTEKGLHVNFGYGAADRGSLEKYRQTAVDSFCTIKLKK